MRLLRVVWLIGVLLLALAGGLVLRAAPAGLLDGLGVQERPPIAGVLSPAGLETELGGLSPGAPEYTPPAADACTSPLTTTLGLSLYSGTFLTSGATEAAGDPLQSCTWGGAAANSKSVWWELAVPEDGQLTVSTISGGDGRYDTVVTIYPAELGCAGLGTSAEIGCDDDTQLFHSRATALVDAGRAYLVEVTGWGQDNPGGYLDLQAIYAPVTRWQWQGSGYPMTRHVVVSDGQSLYALGGYRSANPDEYEIYRFDPASDLWLALASMPVLYANTDGVYLGGFIYVPSGYSPSSGTYVNTHLRYSLADDNWVTLGSYSALSSPVAWGAAAVDSGGQAYYYTGGRVYSAPDVPLAQVLRYDVQTDSWSRLPDMSTPRYAHRAALVAGKLCVVGGLGSGGVVLTSAECYDFGSQSWQAVGSLNIGRFSFGSAVGADGRWYVMGGNLGNESTSAKLEVYDPAGGVWLLRDQTWSLNQSREWPAAVRVGHAVYAWGGYLPASSSLADTLEWLSVPPRGAESSFLPVLLHGGTASGSPADFEPNDSIPLAFGPLLNGSTVKSGFLAGADTEDFFYVRTQATATLRAVLTDIPAGADYDLYLYGPDPATGVEKTLLAASEHYGTADEEVTVAGLPPGRYAVRVRNTWNRHLEQPYSLTLTY